MAVVTVVLALLVLGGCHVDRVGRAPGVDGGAELDARPLDAPEPSMDAGERDAGTGEDRTVPDAPPDPDDGGFGEDVPPPPPDTGCPLGIELCNGVDDDCDPATGDGAAEPTLGTPCDGDDADRCDDGITSCAGSLFCDDPGEEHVEVCNAIDDDCNGTIDDGGVCPCELRRRSGRAYLFCVAGDDWDGARATCQSVGYDLTILGGRPENDWVWTQASSLAPIADDWWIGLRRRSPGRYEWVDGTRAWDGGAAIGFARFRGSGAPDGSGDCVEMGDDDGGGTWNDVECPQVTHFVCEQP